MCLATALFHLARPTKSRRLRSRRCLALVLTTLVLALLLTVWLFAVARVDPHHRAPLPPALPVSALPVCANALVFTGARQGSTWFVDSIENCSYSTTTLGGTRRFADDVFRKTELWKHFGEPRLDGVDMTPHDALRYIARNTSIKIFPSVFWRRRSDIVTMLSLRHHYNLTVLVLRRDVEAAWDSWVRAEATSVWNGASKTANVAFNASLHRYFVESRARYDAGVEALLARHGVPYDVFDYDTAKTMRTIVAENNRCVIRNCNFRYGGVEYKLAEVDGDAASAGEDIRDKFE